MKPSLLAGPAGVAALLLPLLALGSCKAPSGPRDNHWNIESLNQRVPYHMLGYRPGRDGEYKDFQYQQKRDINLTLRRHLFNDNPENPLQHVTPENPGERLPISILPDPVTWFHVSSLAMGGIMLGATGTYIPIPVDSLLALMEPGGVSEFGEGVQMAVTGNLRRERRLPPPPAEFQVKNR